MMNKKEIKAQIEQRLANGEAKSTVFGRMSGQGVSDRKVAHFIASFADPRLCLQHAKLIDAMIVISWIQLVLAVLASIGIGFKMGSLAVLIIAALVGGFLYLFVWGFTHNKAWAYNVTIVLTIVNLPKTLNGVTEHPIATLIGSAVSVALLAFTWYVRSKVFPDFAFISPRKVKGTYVFSS